MASNAPTQLPAYIALRYEENGVFDRFASAAEHAAVQTKKRFDQAFRETESVVTGSLNRIGSQMGKLDLGLGDMRQQAADIRLYRDALDEVSRTAAQLARETGDTSTRTREYLQALSAQRAEADRALTTAENQVTTYTRLQGALDGAADANSRLAQSQRDVYAEAARAAQEEVSARATQSRYAAAYGYDRSATSNGAGFSALAEREALDALRRAEVGAAEGARILEAAHRGTALEIGHTTRSARDAAAAFLEADAATERLAQRQRGLVQEARAAAQAMAAQANVNSRSAPGLDPFNAASRNGATYGALAEREALDDLRRAELGHVESSRILQATHQNTALAFDHTAKSARDSAQAFIEAERAQEALKQEVNSLRLAMDPSLALQQRFDVEMERAERLYRQGAIGAREYGQAQDFARANLQEGHQALFRLNEAQDFTVISSRRFNQAMLQSGQQMQDFAIQVYSGQSAAVAAAQQIPQLAFALSSLEGHTNKTYDRIGRFATFLSGPWGLAVGVAVGGLATLAYEFVTAGQKAEEATGKTYDFSRSIDVLGMSAKSTAEAMKQLADATKSAITEQGDFLNQQAQTANKAVDDITKRLAANRAELRKELALAGTYTLDAGEIYRRINRQSQLREAIKTDEGALSSAREAAANADLALSQRRVASSLDASTAATTAYEEALGRLNVVREKSIALEKSGDPLATATSRDQYMSAAEYERRLGDLQKTRDAAIKAAAEAKRQGDTINRQFGREINLDTARSIATAAGFQVNSGYRSTAKQKELYDAWVRAGKPSDNPVAAPGTSAHERSNALDIQFGPGASVASIRKAYAEEGVKLTKILKERGHFHIEWSTKGADKAVREADAIARKAQELIEFGNQAANAVARISDRFADQPRLISQASAATRDLNSVIADIDARLAEKGIAAETAEQLRRTREDAVETMQQVQDALLRPAADMRRESAQRLALQSAIARGNEDEAAALEAVFRLEQQLGDEQTLRLQVQKLIAQGRDEEARTLQSLLDMYPQMKREVAELAVQDQRRTRELERQRALFEAQLNVLDQARASLTDLLSGRSTDFFGDMKQAIMDLQGKQLFDSVFGDIFQQLEDEMRGQSPLGRESQRFADELSVATNAVSRFAAGIAGGTVRGAANDNAAATTSDAGFRQALEALMTGRSVGWHGGLNPPGAMPLAGSANEDVIEVLGRRPTTIANRSIMEIADKISGAIVTPFEEALGDAFGTEFAQMLGGVMKGALSGYMTGGTTGGILGGLKGIVDQTGIFGGSSGGLSGALGQAGSGAAMGTQIAGIGKALGLKTSTTGAQIGGAIGSFVPIPGGEIIGSIAGGLLGGLFKSNRTAGVVLTGNNPGVVGGKDTGNYGTATGLGGSVLDGLNNIVDRLGGTIGNFMVTIGTRGDEYRVNPNGNSLKIDKGAISFGDDAEAAIAFAIKNAIEDGAIRGMRQSTLNIVKAGKDLEKALQDAVDWEGAFKELEKYKDPVGAAIGDLNDEFQRLIEIGKAGGASLEEMAQLEELYGIKRAEIIKEQNETLLSSLRSLYSDLTTGDNGLSLRQRRNAALNEYDDLAARVQAGDTTAYDDYTQAAQTLLGIERDLYGSQQEYFDRLNEIIDLTKTRIDAETNVVSINENRDSPFDASGAVNKSIQSQTETLAAKLDAVNQNLGTLIGATYSGSRPASSAGAARISFASNF